MTIPHKIEDDIKITKEKWDKTYEGAKNIDFVPDNSDYRYIKKYLLKKGLFLELGCGVARNSFLLSKVGYRVVGLDLSLNAVKIARDNFKKHGLKGLFVCGDMRNMPFKSDMFDSIFAGGSIEHFQDTEKALREVFEILAQKGTFLATVPIVSLSQLTYGQLSGDIPDVFILRHVCSFIHTKIFKSRFMKYGYQKSFPINRIYNLFKRVGFNHIEYGNYETEWEIRLFRSKFIKKILNRISKLRPFWPFIYIKTNK